MARLTLKASKAMRWHVLRIFAATLSAAGLAAGWSLLSWDRASADGPNDVVSHAAPIGISGPGQATPTQNGASALPPLPVTQAGQALNGGQALSGLGIAPVAQSAAAAVAPTIGAAAQSANLPSANGLAA